MKLFAALLLAASLCAQVSEEKHSVRIIPNGAYTAVGDLDFATKDNQHAIKISGADTLGADLSYRIGVSGVGGACFSSDGSGCANAAYVNTLHPLWLYSMFTDDDQGTLMLGRSFDGANWKYLAPNGSYAPGSGQIRDVSIHQVEIGGVTTYLFLATPASATNVQFFTSTDLRTFSSYATFDLSAYVAGATDSWAPEWFTDPASGALGFFITISTDHAATFYPHWFAFNASTSAISGHTAFSITGTSRNQIFDLFPYYDAVNREYYLVYTDQSTNTPTQYLAYAKSSTMTGTYATVTTAGTDYFGFATYLSTLVASEAPIVITLPNGCIRVYADTFDMPYPAGREYWGAYRDYTAPGGSGACAGPPFASSVMSAPVQINIGASEHGTIIPITNPADAQTVFNAEYMADATTGFRGLVRVNLAHPYRYSFTIASKASHASGISYNEPATYAADPGDGFIATLSACGNGFYTCQPPYGGSGRWIIQNTGTSGNGNVLQLNNTTPGGGAETSILFANGLGTYGASANNPVNSAAVWGFGINNLCYGPLGSCANAANNWMFVHSGGTNDFPWSISPSTGEVRHQYGATFGGGGATGTTNTDWAGLWASSSGVLELSDSGGFRSNHNGLFKAGGLVVENNSANTDIHITSTGHPRQLLYETGGVLRWNLRADDTEGGSNTGSDFYIDRLSDAGALLSSPLTINRSTGLVTIASLSVSSCTGCGGSYTLPPPGASTLGGIYSTACPTGYHVTAYTTSGTPTCVLDAGSLVTSGYTTLNGSGDAGPILTSGSWGSQPACVASDAYALGSPHAYAVSVYIATSYPYYLSIHGTAGETVAWICH